MNVKEEKIHFPALKSSTWAGLKTRLQKTSYQVRYISISFDLLLFSVTSFHIQKCTTPLQGNKLNCSQNRSMRETSENRLKFFIELLSIPERRTSPCF